MKPFAWVSSIAATRTGIFFLLLTAAAMEVFGDYFIRTALRGSAGAARIAFFGSGALVLFLYGLFVNLAPWDFGRLLGAYVALFYVVSQLVSIFLLKEPLKMSTLVGGGLIVAGGVVLWWGRR